MGTATKPKIYWEPTKGDSIEGTLVNSGSGLNTFGSPTFKYQIDNGKQIIQFTAPKMLHSLMTNVSIGSTVKVQYDGLAEPEWSKRAGVLAHPYHHYTVWKKNTCPTCGSHSLWQEAVPQRVRKPNYVETKAEVHNSKPPSGKGRTQNSIIPNGLQNALERSIEKTSTVH